MPRSFLAHIFIAFCFVVLTAGQWACNCAMALDTDTPHHAHNMEPGQLDQSSNHCDEEQCPHGSQFALAKVLDFKAFTYSTPEDTKPKAVSLERHLGFDEQGPIDRIVSSPPHRHIYFDTPLILRTRLLI